MVGSGSPNVESSFLSSLDAEVMAIIDFSILPAQLFDAQNIRASIQPMSAVSKCSVMDEILNVAPLFVSISHLL